VESLIDWFNFLQIAHNGAVGVISSKVIINTYLSCFYFQADALFDGRKIRCLTIVDDYSRKCMAIEVGQGLKGTDVISALEELSLFQQVMPRKIQVDNGSELQSNHEQQIKQTQVNNLFPRMSIGGHMNIRWN
jgi:transposase InsO family protein